MASTKPAIQEPTEIAGRYVVEKKLGAGAFGTVYKAKDKVLGRMVAIKTIRLEGLAAQGAGIEEMLQRFTREAQVSATLKHPNIVTIHDLGNADGLSYLAMEFIDGVGLEKIIQGGPVPVERAASLGAQVADALDFAHRHGVVHRDIKPANIMVEAGDRVKVTDFGIAKVTESADHLTMTGSLLGTPSYMSPEQARGAAIDGRSDLFSVGCVLYEMLAGKKAFRGDSITALIFKIITEEPPPLRELAKDVPESLLRVIEKALAKSPEARYQSGRELADDLLAHTRSGSAPTLRQSETPTVPAQAAAALQTLAMPPTLSEAVTAVDPTAKQVATRVAPKAAGAGARPPAPPLPGAPPLPAAPPLTRTPPVARPAAAGPAPAAPVARKSGSGAGLLIGIGIAAMLFIGVLVAGGWYLFLRQPDVPPVSMAETPATVPATLPATQPPMSLAPATVPPEAPPTTIPPTPTAATVTAVNPPATSPAVPPAERRPTRVADAPPPSRNDSPPPRTDPGGSANSFLDEPPPEVDGADAGARAAEAYRSPSGRSSGFGTSRVLQRRELSPRPNGPGEANAIFAVRHLMNAQAMYNKRNGRYGTLSELVRAGILPLANLAGDANGFAHRGYRFEVEAAGESFRVTAMPKGANGRPFVGDESNYIRAGLE